MFLEEISVSSPVDFNARLSCNTVFCSLFENVLSTETVSTKAKFRPVSDFVNFVLS